MTTLEDFSIGLHNRTLDVTVTRTSNVVTLDADLSCTTKYDDPTYAARYILGQIGDRIGRHHGPLNRVIVTLTGTVGGEPHGQLVLDGERTGGRYDLVCRECEDRSDGRMIAGRVVHAVMLGPLISCIPAHASWEHVGFAVLSAVRVEFTVDTEVTE